MGRGRPRTAAPARSAAHGSERCWGRRSAGRRLVRIPRGPLVAAVVEVVAQDAREEAAVPDHGDRRLGAREDLLLELGDAVVQPELKVRRPPDIRLHRVEPFHLLHLGHRHRQLRLWAPLVAGRAHPLAEQRADDPLWLERRLPVLERRPVPERALGGLEGARERRDEHDLDILERAARAAQPLVQVPRLPEAGRVERRVDQVPAG
mmetsp:Transcript_8168/g.25535  ORF Transcript_8168/g.25535 Transcript_8168/m.25535 type:complete len:206 (+) Transcript_8168:153-770(+)